MKLETFNRWRSITGRAGAIFCLLCVISGLDGLVAQFRTPPNEFLALPGEMIHVNGPCSPDIQNVSQLTYESTSEGIRLRFEAMQSGFWLGGSMWRGLLELSSNLEPGDYGVVVRPKDTPGEKPFGLFVIKVFPKAEALRQASRSLILRHFGISPWLVLAVCFGLTGLAFALVYLISQKREHLMASLGRAEIYRVAKTEGFYEVAFGLGTAHGIRAGDSLPILNPRGERVGEVTVTQSFDLDASGTVNLDTVVKPGFVVTRDP
jgi:hypothetical protein